MRLNPQDILESPITEDAELIFKSGTMIEVDDLSPVQYDDSEEYIVYGPESCRLMAVDTAGNVMFFDSDDLESITLGAKDTAALLGSEEVDSTGEAEKPAKDFVMSVHMVDPETGDELEMPDAIKEVLDSFFLGLGGIAIPGFVAHGGGTEKSFLDQ